MKRCIAFVLCLAIVGVMSGCCMPDLLVFDDSEKVGIIEAPDLIGQMYDENTNYGDVVVEISSKEYSDEYENGRIIDQKPKPGTKMSEGDTIRVVVSLGPQPAIKKMEDLSEMRVEQAEAFLNDLKLDLKILTKMEANSSVAEGSVIRTDPIEGETLQRGQTVILWISTGPLTMMADMPKVEGCSQQVAINTLEQSGFFNIYIEEVESKEPAGTVVGQSPYHWDNLKYDVNTPVILQVSKGPAITDDPPMIPPVDSEEDLVEIMMTIVLPYTPEEDCTLTIWKDQELVMERRIYAGTVMVDVKLRGEGLMYFIARLDDTEWTFAVDFL